MCPAMFVMGSDRAYENCQARARQILIFKPVQKIMKYITLIFLLYAATLGFCTQETTTPATTSKPGKRRVATIKSKAINNRRQSPGSGRLSLINYRFNRRPRKKHLDSRELKMVLGTAYDPKFMSIEQPRDLAMNQSTPVFVVNKNSWRYKEMLQQLQAGNLTEELQFLAGQRVEAEFVRMVEKWLLKRASCPVKYAWEDIGALFWPRYIRRGECSVEPGTCSWPPGMHCVPSDTTEIEILRWQCRTPKGKGRKRAYRSPINKEEDKPLHMRCSWVRVPYPITIECMCTC